MYMGSFSRLSRLVPESSITGITRAGSMPPAAVWMASLPIENSMPPTPQSPIPWICSASVARIRSMSSGPAPRLSKASSIPSGVVDRKVYAARTPGLVMVLLHRHPARQLIDDRDHLAQVLREQAVEQYFIAVMQGGKIAVLAQRVREPLVMRVRALAPAYEECLCPAAAGP